MCIRDRREALAAYQAVDIQDVQESVVERDAALRSATMILEASEIISAESMQEPETYGIEVVEPLLLDPDLVLQPIPQIEGDADIELDPLAPVSYTHLVGTFMHMFSCNYP